MSLQAPIEPLLEEAARALFGGDPTTAGSGRVYFDKAPLGVPVTPYLIAQHVGGQPVNGFCGLGMAANARIQFWVWASSAAEAKALIDQLAVIYTSAPFLGVAVTEPVAEYNEPTDGYGVRQDFSFWFYR